MGEKWTSLSVHRVSGSERKEKLLTSSTSLTKLTAKTKLLKYTKYTKVHKVEVNGFLNVKREINMNIFVT